jgi:hypothetical protein
VLSCIGLTICSVGVLDKNTGVFTIRPDIDLVGSAVVLPLVLTPECKVADETAVEGFEFLIVIKAADAFLILPDIPTI